MAGTLRRKPAGGVVSAALTPVANIAELLPASSPGEAREVVFADESLVEPLPLAEERSSYVEETVDDGGVCRVRHELLLVLETADDRTAFDAARLLRLAAEGVAAVFTAATGERLLAGWTTHLRAEQPLRPGTLRYLTGDRPAESPSAILTLSCEDTEPAASIL